MLKLFTSRLNDLHNFYHALLNLITMSLLMACNSCSLFFFMHVLFVLKYTCIKGNNSCISFSSHILLFNILMFWMYTWYIMLLILSPVFPLHSWVFRSSRITIRSLTGSCGGGAVGFNIARHSDRTAERGLSNANYSSPAPKQHICRRSHRNPQQQTLSATNVQSGWLTLTKFI